MGLKACQREWAGTARDREPPWDVWPRGILQVALSITAASRTQGEVPEMPYSQRTSANREV